jgi:acetyl esterase/lipase
MDYEDILSLAPPPADARIAYGSDPHQFGDLRRPRSNPPHPVVMNIHGGYWRNRYNLVHAGHLCAALTAKGLATWNVEYRRVGDQGGGWPGTFEDILKSYRFLPQIAKQQGLQAEQVLVIGHSAGGQLALCLAAHEDSVRQVVALAGVIDLQKAWELHLSNNAVAEFLAGSPVEVAEAYREADPMQLPVSGRQWMIHGSADETVPPGFSRDYYQHKKKRGEDVQLIEIHRAGHFDLIDPRSSAWSQVEQTVLGALR